MNKDQRVFAVPAYYSRFACKGGACRSTCCTGLTITVSLEEYRKLIGLSCPEDVRRDLDASFSLRKDADRYKNADMHPNFFGSCRMLGADGLCRLQTACGESALSSACRYFPRAVRYGPLPLCCCGNGCEKTLELLADPEIPDRLDHMLLSFELPYDIPSDSVDQADRTNLTLRCAEIMVSPDSSFPQKPDLLRELVNSADPRPEDSADTADELRSILEYMGKQSGALTEYADAALCFLDDHPYDVLQPEIPESVLRVYPFYERFLSRVLANDILFRGFPSGDPRIAPELSFRVFERTVLALLMMVEAGLDRIAPAGTDGLIDLLVHFFRLVELTDHDAHILALIGDGHF